MNHVVSISLLLITHESDICFERVLFENYHYLRLPFILLNSPSHEALLQSMLPSNYLKSVSPHIVPYSDNSLSTTKVYKHYDYNDSDDLYVKIPLRFFTKDINWLNSHIVHGELISFASCKILQQLLF